MKKSELVAAVQTFRTETRNALQTIYDAMNQGQRKQIVKEDAVKALLDRYGVERYE